jgi:hypothetical protein
MKHATSACLGQLSGLLSEIRVIHGLVEKKPGIFYVKGKSYLHFHEDPAGIFADARIDSGEFSRFPVNSDDEKQQLLNAIREALKS